MNRVGRALLLAGGLVLAFLVGLLVGRGEHGAQATPTETAATANMQINTTAAAPPIQPLPAPPPPPKRAPIPTLDPNAQVNADAAAVGLTTPSQPASDDATNQSSASAPASDDAQASAPNG